MTPWIVPSRRLLGTGLAGLLVCLFVLSRTIPAPEYLYYFDSVNFALALEEFNPALHQPQPPGYPLFVAVTRLVYRLTASAQQAFIATGILASAAGLMLMWRLGRDLFGNRAGVCAAALLAFSPPFWFGGLTNQVRLFLVLGGAGVMLAAWRSMQEKEPRWFYAAALILGVASGFRPELLMFSTPVVIYAGVKARRTWMEWAVAGSLGGGVAVAWMAVVSNVVGGPAAYLALIQDYSQAQFSGTAVPFGAETQPAVRMFKMAVIWYGAPLLTWIWVLPFTRGLLGELRGSTGFLAVALLPGFLFHAFIHVGDPDHTLISAPVVNAIGGLALARARFQSLIPMAVVLNAVLFFLPQRGIGRAYTYYAVKDVDSVTRQTLGAVRELKKGGPVVLVTYDHPVTWRHLSYYFPNTPLVVLRDDPQRAASGSSAWLIHRAKKKQATVLSSEVRVPAGVRVVWLLSRGRGTQRLLEGNANVKTHLALPFSETRPGSDFRVGRYRFIAAPTALTP